MNVDHALRADLCASPTGNTLFFIYFCHTIFIDRNRSEFTFIYASSTSNTAVLTSCLAFCCPASAITCHNCRTIWKLLLYCHTQHFLSYGVPVRGRLYRLSPSRLKYASAIAGAVGIEVISPIPIAPHATFNPGLSITIASIFGIS